MEALLFISWLAACGLLLWLSSLIEKKGKIRQGLVSDADDLTQNAEYSCHLEHYAQQLADITQQLQECQRDYGSEQDPARRAELLSRMELLRKKQDLARMKCSNLLRKLD